MLEAGLDLLAISKSRSLADELDKLILNKSSIGRILKVLVDNMPKDESCQEYIEEVKKVVFPYLMSISSNKKAISIIERNEIMHADSIYYDEAIKFCKVFQCYDIFGIISGLKFIYPEEIIDCYNKVLEGQIDVSGIECISINFPIWLYDGFEEYFDIFEPKSLEVYKVNRPFFDLEFLRRVEFLRITAENFGMGDDYKGIIYSEFLSNLRGVEIAGNMFCDNQVDELVNSRNFSNIEFLGFNNSGPAKGITDKGLNGIANSDNLKKLKSLSVIGGFTDLGLTALGDSSNLESLVEVDVTYFRRNHQNFSRFIDSELYHDLTSISIYPKVCHPGMFIKHGVNNEEVGVIANSNNSRNLEHLSIKSTLLNDESARVMIESGNLDSLKSLKVTDLFYTSISESMRESFRSRFPFMVES